MGAVRVSKTVVGLELKMETVQAIVTHNCNVQVKTASGQAAS